MTEQSDLSISVIESIHDSQANLWTDWLADNAIFTSPSFLTALEDSQSVSKETGWQPHHLLIQQNATVKGFLPVYIKSHSYGEYMFDWQWANGFHSAGLQYYPKAVSAVPFTPVGGSRLITESDNIELQKAIINFIKDQHVSNFQCLFSSQEESKLWQDAGALIRHGYQFTWYNNNYQNFDDFLARLRSSYRKKIRRERRLINHCKLCFKRYYGDEITQEVWEFFIICYKRTYLKRSGHEGYLNQDFFNILRSQIPTNLLIVMAEYDGEPIASSLCFVAGDTLYGRYWGTLHDIDGLHFEVCYYQGIEFCIEQKLASYHPGTQGEYKRRRGFIPEFTYGAYVFNTPNIIPAIADYLQQESRQIQFQMDDWQRSSPYKDC